MTYTPTSWVDDQTPLTAANLNKLETGTRDAYTQAHGVLNAKDVAYAGGAKGDGVTDDTAALQAFLNDFATKSAGNLGSGAVVGVIPPGIYKITSKLTLTFAGFSTTAKQLLAYGARLMPTIASGHSFEIGVSGSGNFVNNMSVEGLTIEGTNATDTAAALFHVGCSNPANAFYRAIFRDITLQSFLGHGMLIDGDVFECAIETPHLAADNSNTVGNCLHVTGGGAGAGSSIDVYGGTMVGGLHNIYGSSAGIKVFGGTYLQAYNEAIYLTNPLECGVTGSHIENAWQGGVASPGWSISQAGIYMDNAGTLVNVTGTQNNNKMRYIARLYAVNPMSVIGGQVTGGVDYYLRAEGSGGKITAIGIGSGVTGAIHDNSGGPIVKIGVRADITGGAGAAAVQVIRGAVQMDTGPLRQTLVTLAYSASITPDASQGDIQSVTASNGTAFTINKPTNGPDSSHSQRLTIEVVNLSGGAMGAITWDSSAGGYHFAGFTWTNPAFGACRRVVFEWSQVRGKWIAVSVSAADY